MRKLTSIIVGAMVFASLTPLTMARGDDATVSVTIPFATTFTLVNATCNLGQLPAGSDTRTSGFAPNCVTYSVASNVVNGFYVTLTGGTRPQSANGSPTTFKSSGCSGACGFYIERHGAGPMALISSGDVQSEGAVTGTHWQDATTPGTFNYGDDLSVNLSAAQPPATISQTLTYTATGK